MTTMLAAIRVNRKQQVESFNKQKKKMRKHGKIFFSL